MDILNNIFKKPLKVIKRHLGGLEPIQHLDNPFVLEGTADDKIKLAGIVNRVALSSFGKSILEEASAQKFTLRMDDLGQTVRGNCNAIDKTITLSSRFPEAMEVVTLTHEARHAGQIGRGAIGGYDPEYTFSSQLMHKRLMEADAVACSLVVAKDLHDNQADCRPLMAARLSYGEMIYAYETALLNGETKQKAMTDCALTWYENSGVKFAYEKYHLVDPIKEGFYSIGSGKQKDFPIKESIHKICVYKNKNYFTESAVELLLPTRSGVSVITDKWIQNHIKEAAKIGADVKPFVDTMPVYKTAPVLAANAEKIYSTFPSALSESGKARLHKAVLAGKIAKLSAVQKRIFKTGKDR